MQAQKLFILLERLSLLLRNDTRQRGLLHGLQPVQVEALLYLSRCNRYSNTPQAVTDYLGTTKGTVSQTLKALERKGFLAKERDSDDGRVVRLQLTTAGTAVADELEVPEILTAALAGDGAPAEGLEVDLRGLLAAVQRSGRFRTFGACHSCAHFLREKGGFRCGLTREPLSTADSELICREHAAH